MGQDIAIGTWRTHFSYSNARILVATEGKVFCAVENGLFSREIGSGVISKISKVNGLSDAKVSAMAYEPNAKVLVIGYQSGKVDFIYEDQLISVDDIANSNLEGSKRINQIALTPNSAYLATDFGVVVFAISTGDIIENYIQIGSNGGTAEIKEMVVRNDSIFVRTNEGIQVGDIRSNLLDFNNWTFFSGTSSYDNLIEVEEELYAMESENIMRYSLAGWQDTGVDIPVTATRLFNVDGTLVTADANGQVYRMENIPTDPFSAFLPFLVTNAQSVNDILQMGNEIFIADGSLGLLNGPGEELSPDGPIKDEYSNLTIIANEVYAFHAPDPVNYSNDGSLKIDGYSLLTEGEWRMLVIPEFYNVSDVAVFNDSKYFTSIGKGLYLEKDNLILQDIPGSSSALDTMLTGIDAKERLWTVGFHVDESAHSLSNDGNWNSYSTSILTFGQYLSVDVSQRGIAWIKHLDGSIIAIDGEQNEITQLNSFGFTFPTQDISISIEDNAWVSTTKGPFVFPDASLIFIDGDGVRPTFENRILFEGERVNSIVTDGGNRVWFGTNRGLWVFDENISEQIAVFNEDNSPIPSNTVLDLAYNGRTGEVFIVTDKGMVSYRSASSIGNRDHRNVSVFPNPVRPEYQGQVGISGLAKNASVKITDINGNLVKEIDANGGTASWDLLNINGIKVATGIYFFFSSSADGEETFVGKIAVVR